MQDSTAVSVARTHIEAWCNHDWSKTRELLAADVHATVQSIQSQWGSAELTGADKYMEPKIKAAQRIEPGSLRVISATGDEQHALVVATFRIGLGPGGAMVTMVRACLYLVDENRRIKEERDLYYVQ